MSALRLAATLGYPVLVHLGVLFGLPLLQWVALLALLLVVFLPRLQVVTAVLIVLALAALTAWLSLAPAGTRWQPAAGALAFVVPVVLHGLLFTVFARTLRRGQVPLVTAIGTRARGPLSPAMQHYTRGVTQLWAGLFALLFLLSLLLPFVSMTVWSWCTNVLNYAVVALVVGGEFAFRRLRFPEADHPSFLAYLRILVRADVRHF